MSAITDYLYDNGKGGSLEAQATLSGVWIEVERETGYTPASAAVVVPLDEIPKLIQVLRNIHVLGARTVSPEETPRDANPAGPAGFTGVDIG